MATFKSSTSRQTRANRRRQDLVNEKADSISKAQKSAGASVFDFNELDGEEFDVLSARRNFRRRKVKDSGPKKKQQPSLFTDTKCKQIALVKGLTRGARKQEICDDKMLDLEKKLFSPFVGDGKVSKEGFPSERTEPCSMEVLRNQVDEKLAEIQCENEICVQESDIKKSIIDISIEKLEKSKSRNNEQDAFCRNNRDEGIENVLSHQSATSRDAVKSCPVCLVSFTQSQSDNEITIHVNTCLDFVGRKQENCELLEENVSSKEPSSVGHQNECTADEDFARELQERENAKIVEERLSNDLFFCGICQKDLNRLSAASRQIHINKCADFSEKENAAMRKAQRMSLRGIDKEFECLICGEMFNNILQKVAHTKKCCKQNNVDVPELLHLVREMASNNLTSSSAQNTQSQRETSAKAVSSLLRSKNDKLAIETGKAKKSRKKKISNEEIPILLTRSEEEAKKMAMAKATEIIEEQTIVHAATDTSDHICMPESKVGIRYKRKMNGAAEALDKQANVPKDIIASECQGKDALPKCATSLWDFSDIRTSLFETQKFYVLDVFEGDLERTIERLNKRGNAVITDDQMAGNTNSAACNVSKSDHNSTIIDHKNTMDAETNPRDFEDASVERNEKFTALDNLEISDDTKRKVINGERDEKDRAIGSGFLETDSNENHNTDMKMKLNRIASRANESLISSLEFLLNDEETKDVRLLCADGKVHKAHGSILFARCPTLRKGADAVELKGFKEAAVKEVLKYIYTGRIDAEMEYPEEVHDLAKWLSLDLLIDACHVLLTELEPGMEASTDDEDKLERSVKDLEKTLWHTDTNQDTEEEEEEEQFQKGLGGCDSPFDQSDEEDLRFYIATQREKQSSRSSFDDERRKHCQDNGTFDDKILKDTFIEDGTSCSPVENVKSVNLPTRCDKLTDLVAKGRTDRSRQRVDNLENVCMDSVCEKAMENEGKLGRIIVDFNPSSVDTALTDVTLVRSNLEDRKERDSELGSRTCGAQSGSPSKSIDNADFEDATTGLHIVDLRSPNPEFTSDEEDLFDSINSGGLDKAICLNENDDCSSLAGKQMDTRDDKSTSQQLDFNEMQESQFNGTPKPFERTVITPDFFSSEKCDMLNDSRISSVSSKFCQGILTEYDVDVANRSSENGENTVKPDFNCDSIANEHNSDSVESQSNLFVNNSTLCYSSPISPCVTTSQFDRKGNTEGTDQFGSSEVSACLGLPTITQKTVICLDEDESSEDENVIPMHVRKIYEDSCTMHSAKNVVMDSSEGDPKKTRKNINTYLDSTAADVSAEDFKTVSVASTEEESNAEEYSTSERFRKEGRGRISSESPMRFSPQRKTSINKFSDDIICLTPLKTNRVDKLGTSSQGFKSESFDKSYNSRMIHDVYVDDATADDAIADDAIADDALADITIASQRSLSPEIPISSPEFLPSSCDKRRHCAKSPGSLSRKRKIPCDYGASSTDDEEAAGKHPVKKSKVATIAHKMPSNERKSCDLKPKSYACISDENLSEEYDKATTNRGYRSSHEMEHSDSSAGSDSRKSQMRGGNEGDSEILQPSFVDSFDDGGFNPDIQCERFVSSSCTFDGINVNGCNAENEEHKNHGGELRNEGNVIEIDSDNDMFDFEDDGGFNGDIGQSCSPGIGKASCTEYSPSACRNTHPQSPNCESMHEENPDECFSHKHWDNSVCPAICNDIVDVEIRGTDISKSADRMQKNEDYGPRKTNALGKRHAVTAQTPRRDAKAFLPGCGVHPETGLAITPMSDYDALQTPVLTKRVKKFGLRKLPKHQMAGKLREIYKMKHGFTEWEEPPTKAKRKVPRKPTVPGGKANADSIASALTENSDISHNSESETSSDDERQKTFESCYVDDIASTQASSQADQTLSEKLMKFVLERKDLYEQILTYQKLNFEEFYNAVKEAKIKCSKSRLADFLDEQCICFVVPKADDKPRARRRRKNK